MTNESTEQGVREAVARIIAADSMKSLVDIRAEWQKWSVENPIAFGDGPRKIDMPAMLDKMAQQEYDELARKRTSALAKADAILATLSPDDIRQEEARLTPEKVSNAALLGRFGHHPDPAIDFEIEVQAIVAVHADLAAGLREDERSGFADRIARAMTFRAGGDPISVAAKQTLREVEHASRKPANKPCLMFGYKCFCHPKDRPSCVHYSDDYDYNAAIRSQPSREGKK